MKDKFLLLNRAATIWNLLPSEIAAAETFNRYKARIERHMTLGALGRSVLKQKFNKQLTNCSVLNCTHTFAINVKVRTVQRIFLGKFGASLISQTLHHWLDLISSGQIELESVKRTPRPLTLQTNYTLTTTNKFQQ